MTLANKSTPSYGRLCKLLTALGPYFRKQQSTQESFFFDCLEICLDSEKEPEQREFYGWWLVLKKQDGGFYYQRFDGLYNEQGEWLVESLTASQQVEVDKSFTLFFNRLQTLIELETGLSLSSYEAIMAE